MTAKKYNSLSAFVYSTNPDFKPEDADEQPVATVAPAQQVLRIRLETKHRGGKAVSLVSGFQGTETDLEQLGKQLKTICGTGGTVKDGDIIIQGDHRDKMLQWLQKNGYIKTKKG
jgi:translation initiation factor 1